MRKRFFIPLIAIFMLCAMSIGISASDTKINEMHAICLGEISDEELGALRAENANNEQAQIPAYGYYHQLKDEAFQATYLTILYAMDNYKTSEKITLPMNISLNNLKIVFEAVINDNPKHFWIANNWAYYTRDGNIVALLIYSYEYSTPHVQGGTTCNYGKADIEKINLRWTEMASGIADLKSNVTSSMSNDEKIKQIHDNIVNRAKYGENADNSAHNIYGILSTQKTGVCESYAETLKYMLDLYSIQSYIVTGHGNGEPHEWNVVRTSTGWRECDVTWDDPINISNPSMNYLRWDYYNITSEKMNEDHTRDAVGCSRLAPTSNTPITSDPIKLAAPTNLTFTNGIATWNAVTDATSYSIQLFKDGVNTGITTLTTSEITYNLADKVIPNNGEGKYTFKVKALSSNTTKYLNSDYSVISSEFTYTIKNTPDINADGKVNILDLVKLFSIVANAEYDAKYDFNKDMKLNLDDIKKLLAIILA